MAVPGIDRGPRFAGQVALVTGAASGIGQATAVLLAEEGARVLVADIDEARMAETVARITRAGGVASARPLDVMSESAWDAAIDDVTKRWGPLHVLVNSAGIALVCGVADMTLDQWRRVLSINLDGVFLGTRAGIRAMRGSGGGSIVNVSSASGLKAAAASSAYCASKAAVIHFSKSAALECANDGSGIRINVVAPGGVKTPLWSKTEGAAAIVESEIWQASAAAPLGKRFAEPVEIASCIAFLASAEASYVTGAVLPIDAGYTA